jgi:glutaredoxin 3|tara:strand:+ start:154 stop:417 length:264 start_codon:yes stop_codon:yes gene_type:complete
MDLNQALESKTDFLVISTNVCFYCIRAKNILDAKGFSYYEINGNEELEVHLEARKRTGWRTVPIIWDLRNEQPIFVGGSDELMSILN